MGLVDYASDSGSDAEAGPSPPPLPPKSNPSKTTTTTTTTATAKPGTAPKKPFQKLVDRAEPGKIRRARTGGGAFSGFNAFLPAPKKPSRIGGGVGAPSGDASVSSGGAAQRVGAGLKTGAGPGFTTPPPRPLPPPSDPYNPTPYYEPQEHQQAQEPETVSSLASNLNLDATAMRELFGRSSSSARGGPAGAVDPNTRVVNFNLDAEYRRNQALIASGELVPNQRPARAAIQGGGKHSLRQLVNAVASQRDSLEERFAEGKNKRKEAGARYGW
ncbi:unnamed protein product [Parascedosporium putredinis]|uniref:Mitotic checkpoint regulator, MAD2B-interacting-domain-containing protein n=1 Tax=Parascedosporium putredinis TaxID=1442378 RepID=A0A9P1H8U0_9PEZI|nr:unnamed protein product [Parascedosporium putredinis]CAI8002432.1 unnamed protein product [Parascedosporium putredinis]